MAEKPKKDMDIARKVWLAGIGAYGRAIDDAQEAYAKVGKETTKIFDDLVGKGAELENKVSDVALKYAPEIAQKHRTNIEDRMERMKAALGMTEAAADQQEQISSIETRLDAIDAKLDKLLAAVTSQSSGIKSKPKSAARKPAARPRKAPAKKSS
jgi:hypothetical protein